MSYSGTVYCSWCHNRGHNKAGCEDRKTFIKENPDGWEARKEKQKKEERVSRVRRCSYCSVPAHTRRTCEVINRDRVTLVKYLKAKRAEIAEQLCKHGFSVGTLVEATRGYYTSDKELAVITSLNWKKLNDVRFNALVMFVSDGSSREKAFRLTDAPRSTPVVSGLTEELIRQGLPRSWVSGTFYDEDDYFDEKGKERSMFFHQLENDNIGF